MQGLDDLLVLGRGDARRRLDEVDARPQAVPEVGHFQADGPGADDGQAFGRLLQIQQIRGVEDALMVRLEAREPVR